MKDTVRLLTALAMAIGLLLTATLCTYLNTETKPVPEERKLLGYSGHSDWVEATNVIVLEDCWFETNSGRWLCRGFAGGGSWEVPTNTSKKFRKP